MVSPRLARGPVHSGGVGAVMTVLLLVLLASGCGGSSTKGTKPGRTTLAGGDPALARALSFDYQRLGRVGEMDQTLMITSAAKVPMTVTAVLVALDADGNQLPRVTVSSVFGTERGERVLMPGENIDALAFGGTGAAEVRGISVQRISATATRGVRPAPEPVSARVVDEVERTVATRFAGGGVLVENRNDTALDVQVVLIIWSRPAKGESQQAEQVLHLGAARVPARGKVEVKPSATDAATIDKFGMSNAETVKAYVVP